MSRSFSVRITAACLLVTMAACTTWDPIQMPVGPQAELPRQIRLTLHDGERVVLETPYLEGDSVYVGLVDRAEARRVPVAAVARVEEGQDAPQALKFLAVVGGVVLFLAVVWAASCTEDSDQITC
ncbi:MAG: hypothetical protein JSU98_16885 [Gemmatimonadales bacterium]|nr:MAG: hypothetical protein JSU98_16885 [Gemmatimonadales bacterium]